MSPNSSSVPDTREGRRIDAANAAAASGLVDLAFGTWEGQFHEHASRAEWSAKLAGERQDCGRSGFE